MTVIKNTFAALMMAAAGGYIIYAIAYMPTKSGGQMLAGPALFAFIATAVILINNTSGPIARKLRRLERDDLKRLIAHVTLWLVAIVALVYSII